MKIGEVFETSIEEKIEPVIKVGDTADETKLAKEIGSYVVTPKIEEYLDSFLDHYTDSFQKNTEEIGVWISGYFGSGKSHLAKILGLLIENRALAGQLATRRFEQRIPPDAGRRNSIVSSLSMLKRGTTKALAFNLNTLADSRSTPLPRLLLGQFYQSKGYGSNVGYARVIEAGLEERGKLPALHEAVQKRAGKSWAEIQRNPSFYAKHLYAAAVEVAPEVFSKPEDVQRSIDDFIRGDLVNVQFLVDTILQDLRAVEKRENRPQRLMLIMDESGQWIEDDGTRLAQLQALVETAAIKGLGKIWIIVTTHEDMGSMYQKARALKGDMQKIESRFRFKFSLTTENIELVLEDRLFKKRLAGQKAVEKVYDDHAGVVRGLGELADCAQQLPHCTRDKFVSFYPFFPYQIHLIPQIVKSLRSAGGRGEELSGSTRTLLAIAQDIMRAGRRKYLDAPVGQLVSFDEIYGNLSGEAEVKPDVRHELAQIKKVVPGATDLTQRVAEILYLIHEITYIPRTLDNIARLLVEDASERLEEITSRVKPELERLRKAKLVGPIGEEYEFLTGERRTFESDVAEVSGEIRQQDREAALAQHFSKADIIGFETILFMNHEFGVKITLDGTAITKEGHVEVRVFSPLAGTNVSELESQSLSRDEKHTLFVLSDRIPNFDRDLDRYIAMREVIDKWKSDSTKSPEARKLAVDREAVDLDKLRDKVVSGIREGLLRAKVIHDGSSRALAARPGQKVGEALRSELSTYWSGLYPKFDRVPVRLTNEGRAITDVLNGAKAESPEVRALKIYDGGGRINVDCALLDALRVFLGTRQDRKDRTMGKDLVTEFTRPPYGWDRHVLRLGIAALVYAGRVKVVIGRKPYTNAADADLQKAIRDSRDFEKVELVLEETEVPEKVLRECRELLIKLTGERKIDETPAALHEAAGRFFDDKRRAAEQVRLWADATGFPLPTSFVQGTDAIGQVLALTSPVHRVNQLHAQAETLKEGVNSIDALATFQGKQGREYSAMKGLAQQLRAIEHLLPDSSSSRSYLADFATAQGSCGFLEKDVWRRLLTERGAAGLELDSLVTSSRESAKIRARQALESIHGELDRRQLPRELEAKVKAPIERFLGEVDQETEPVRAAALPDRAERLAKDLARALDDEEEATARKQETKKRKKVARVRASEILGNSRIRSVGEWEAGRDKLDKHVRDLLDSGNEVELS